MERTVYGLILGALLVFAAVEVGHGGESAGESVAAERYRVVMPRDPSDPVLLVDTRVGRTWRWSSGTWHADSFSGKPAGRYTPDEPGR